MKKIFKFSEFLNEKYINERFIESPEYMIKSFFDELTKNINDWFTTGSFAANGAQLGDINISNLSDVDKNLIFDFDDDQFHYQVYIIISLKDVGEEELDTCYITVKKYDSDGNLFRKLSKDVNVRDITEDKILELYANLDAETSEEATVETLPDSDSDLQDTSIV